MELTGKIIAALPVRSGVSQRTDSEWQLASYVLETQGERFARKMVFEVFGSDRIQQMNIQVGETLRVSFDIDARETSEGRWFNSIRAWAVDRNVDVAPTVAAPSAAPFDPAPAPSSAPAPSQAPFEQAPDNESLPF